MIVYILSSKSQTLNIAGADLAELRAEEEVLELSQNLNPKSSI